jgi:hypothetical protein
MWLPFIKSRIPEIKEVSYEDDGNTVKILHSKGAVKFAKSEVLHTEWKSDIFSSSKKNFITYNAFLSLILTGGFANLFWTVHPPSTFDSRSLILNLYFLLSIVLGFILSRLILIIIKQIRLSNDLYDKDVFLINLNNSNIQLRLDPSTLSFLGESNILTVDYLLFEEFQKEKSKLKYDPGININPDDLPKFLFQWYLDFIFEGKFTIFYVPLAILLYILFYNIPFWYYNFPLFEDVLEGFLPNDTLQYFEYYHHQIDQILAFFHGILSVFLFPIFILIVAIFVISMYFLIVAGMIGGVLLLGNFYFVGCLLFIWGQTKNRFQFLHFIYSRELYKFIAFTIFAIPCLLFTGVILGPYLRLLALGKAGHPLFKNLFAILIVFLGGTAWWLYSKSESYMRKTPDEEKRKNLYWYIHSLMDGKVILALISALLILGLSIEFLKS